MMFSFVVHARTVDDIQKEIDDKQNELSTVNTDIQELEASIEEQKAALEQVSGKRAGLNYQISINKAEIELIQKRLDDLKEKEELNKLEQEKRKVAQDILVSESYLNWKQNNTFKEIVSRETADFTKIITYQSIVATQEQTDIEQLQLELNSIKEQLENSEKQREQYQLSILNLDAQVGNIETELADLDTKIKGNESDLGNYRARVGVIQSEIDELSKEQAAVQEQEDKLLEESEYEGGKEISSGEIYFEGVGREVYQGHGVGMSQFGALGAALKGWDYERIVEFYYPGAKLETYTGRDTITVQGYGQMSVEDYVAGAGEVPDFACEDLGEEFDANNLWKCWPEEAIKAQVVAFRSYGINKTQDGSSICTDARCQVYKGGENKRWAADDTEYEVLMYDGQPISAFYSSDNHNGWGTANNDTVWSNFEGVGAPKPYLRAVNDSAIAYNYVYTKWTWSTNGYTTKDLDTMLEWSTTSSKASGSYKSFLTEVKNEVGEITALDFNRDPSGRVKKVKITGTKGSREIAGWLFKSVWNIWVGNEEPKGEKDYIYSLTYYLKTKG